MKYIAYFQSHCNTYGPSRSCGGNMKPSSAIKTSSACRSAPGPTLRRPVFSLLEELNRRIYLSVELGLQSIHESLLLLNRNHSFAQFVTAFNELRSRGSTLSST